MFKNSFIRKITVSAIIVLLVLGTVGIAANNVFDKKLTATHGSIKFMVDGKDVTAEIEKKYESPAFTVREYNDRSYVPVRAMAELMGMEIKYDASTHTAEIIDVKTKKHLDEIKSKDKEIEKLKKELKKDVVEEKGIKELEKELNKKYGTYNNIDFSISLIESKSRIDVELTTDLYSNREETAWNNMIHNEKKIMIGKIVDDIYKVFDKSEVYGFVYDKQKREKLITFNQISSGNLNIAYLGRQPNVYGDDIDDIVYNEFRDASIYDLKVSNVRVGRDSVLFDIDIDYRYRSKWNDLGVRGQLNLMDDIAYRIDRSFYYDRDYDRNYDRYMDMDIRIYLDGSHVKDYTRNYDETKGRFK